MGAQLARRLVDRRRRPALAPDHPSRPLPGQHRGVFFRDPRHGWAFAEEGHEGDEHPVFFSTADGGRRWTRSPTPIEGLLWPAAEASFSAIGGARVFALVRQEGDTAEDFGCSFAARTAGAVGTDREAPPQAGRIAFESARDGWLAGGYPNPRLWRTRDGGRDWTEVTVPTPPAVKRVDSISYLPPRIGAGGRGLLAAVVVARPNRDTTAVLYSTADRGRHWRIAATKRLPGAGGWLEATSVLALRGGRTAVAHSPVRSRATVLTANGRGPTRPSRNLTEWATMRFSGARFGFAYSAFGHDRALLHRRRRSELAARRPGARPHALRLPAWRGARPGGCSRPWASAARRRARSCAASTATGR